MTILDTPRSNPQDLNVKMVSVLLEALESPHALKRGAKAEKLWFEQDGKEGSGGMVEANANEIPSQELLAALEPVIKRMNPTSNDTKTTKRAILQQILFLRKDSETRLGLVRMLLEHPNTFIQEAALVIPRGNMALCTNSEAQTLKAFLQTLEPTAPRQTFIEFLNRFEEPNQVQTLSNVRDATQTAVRSAL